MEGRNWYTPVKPEEFLEMNDGTTQTEQAYVPASVQIAQMIRAGQNLDAYRKELYDFSEEEGDLVEEYYDPTRDPGYDMADASQALIEVAKRQKEARKRAEAEIKVAKEAERSEADKATDESKGSVTSKSSS